MYKLLLALFCSILTVSTFANNSALKTTAIGYSYVSLTNNTDEKINIDSSLISGDPFFAKGEDWDEFSGIILPYETKLIAWFSRDKHVVANELYHFNFFIRPEIGANLPLSFDFYVKGKTVFGSEIFTELTLPGQVTQKIFARDGLEKYSAPFWNSPHDVYARTWLPLGNVFNSYHFAINKPLKHPIATPANNQISVLTYNTQLLPFYARAVDDLNQPSERAVQIPKRITGYDVAILEELFDRDLRIQVVNAMSKHYPYHTKVVGKNTNKLWTGGVIIFSKYPIVREEQMVYNASSGIDSLAAKGAVYAVIDKAGKRYHVIGTHLQADRNKDSQSARAAQLSELAGFVKQLAIPQAEPLMFGGDFNIDQDSGEFYNLVARLNVSLPENLGYRYSIDHTVNTMMVDKLRQRIDYVFYSNDHAKPLSANNTVFVLRGLSDEQMWPKFDLSDHFPVISYFEFG